MKKNQTVHFKFNKNDDDEICKFINFNSATDRIGFRGRNIWLEKMTSMEKYELKNDLKEYANFLLELSEEIDPHG